MDLPTRLRYTISVVRIVSAGMSHFARRPTIFLKRRGSMPVPGRLVVSISLLIFSPFATARVVTRDLRDASPLVVLNHKNVVHKRTLLSTSCLWIRGGGR